MLTLEQAAVRVASHPQDVAACLHPLVELGVLVQVGEGSAWRLSDELHPGMREIVERVGSARSPAVERDRKVRHELLAGMVGVDPKMQLVAELVRQVARLDVPVLITGGSGTGKELVARAIHALSARRDAFFGGLNCATLTESLFEAQMFGHARGAFTDAHRAAMGVIERCDKGSLFLDEIGELSAMNQAKLLRVLQERAFTRVGETRLRRSGFRLISATNRDLTSLAAEGLFREDLYYRINVFLIRLPALRERIDDLPFLVEDILEKQGRAIGRGGAPPRLSAAAVERLKARPWPGNIRELQSVVLRAAIAARDGDIEEQHVERAAQQAPSGSPQRASPRPLRPAAYKSLADVESEHILEVLSAMNGNVSAAASVLRISRTTLYKKLREARIELKRIAIASAPDR